MDTLLLIVGIFVFMITVFGTVVAGGEVLRQKRNDELAAGEAMVIDDNGYEQLVTVDADADPAPS